MFIDWCYLVLTLSPNGTCIFSLKILSLNPCLGRGYFAIIIAARSDSNFMYKKKFNLKRIKITCAPKRHNLRT